MRPIRALFALYALNLEISISLTIPSDRSETETEHKLYTKQASLKRSMTLKKKVYWEPAVLFAPESDQNIRNIRHKTFLPSYVREEPQMGLILSWHYGRQWLKERQDHENTIRQNARKSNKFIPPNFSKWLENRKPNITRRQRASLKVVAFRPKDSMSILKKTHF